VKVNIIPEGSDAGIMMGEEVFGIVKGDYPERSGGGSAGIGGAGERGGSPFAPASFIEQVICLAASNLDLNGGLGSAGDSAYLIVDW